MTLKSVSSNTTLDDVVTNQPAQNKSILVKILLAILALAIFSILIFAAIFNFISPKNPYKTDAFLVTVNGNGTPFSALEEDTDGDKKIWVPRSKDGVLVGVRDTKNDDTKLNFALVFGTEYTVEINSKTTARTLAALHPVVENTANFYRDNQDFGEIEIPSDLTNRDNLDGTKINEIKESMKKSLQKLYENNTVFPQKDESFKPTEITNVPEKKFEYPDKILKADAIEFESQARWFPVNFAVDKYGPILQNTSNMNVTALVEDAQKNLSRFNISPNQTLRLDKELPWQEGKYKVAAQPNSEIINGEMYANLLQHTTGSKSDINTEFLTSCFTNQEKRENCILPGIIDIILQQNPAENNEQTRKFTSLFLAEEMFFNTQSELPEKTDFTQLPQTGQYLEFSHIQTGFTVLSPTETYTNTNFALNLEYPVNWEVEKTESGENIFDLQNFKVILKKGNGVLTIDGVTFPEGGRLKVEYCTKQAEFTAVKDKFYRIDAYKYEDAPFLIIKPDSNKFIYLDDENIDLKKIKNMKPSIWTINNTRNLDQVCVSDIVSGFIEIKTTIPRKKSSGYKPGTLSISYQWEGDLDQKNLAEAEKIIDSLKYIKYR